MTSLELLRHALPELARTPCKFAIAGGLVASVILVIKGIWRTRP